MTAMYKALACTISIDAVFNWIDFQIVRWWINGESKQFKQFVQNRVMKIRSLWSKEHWGETLTEIRLQFWIIKRRQAVKNVLTKCITCKRIQGRAFSSPPPLPLPSFRVSDDLAFSKVGVDFAGPLYVKNIY